MLVKQVLDNFFKLCPDVETCMQVTMEEIEEVIRTLGLQVKRSGSLQHLSREYLTETWTYVTELHGVGNILLCMSRYIAEQWRSQTKIFGMAAIKIN
ncbi:putative DNA glycosylase [Medicago truncatula]|uniref:HhH-GPD base excision DNA repair family protein n=1 Tax=Medicago truncatula TaxID=3880 RepID=G7KHN8_MEDTR|nr:HhH-GPD base excision DNA repair family protein [Medicago truncatula]RHN51157.1 putative DNA glycosylase [Medicago truncatula]